MSEEFVKGVQELFDTFDVMRRAEACGNSTEVRTALEEGLEKSCHLLQYLLSSSSLLHSAHPTPEPWKSFRDLAKQGRLEEFLNGERHILLLTGLKPPLVELILTTLNQVIVVMIEKRCRLEVSWAISLTRLADSVCALKAPTEEKEEPRRRRSFKRACLGATGGLVMGLNVWAEGNPEFQLLLLHQLPLVPRLFQLSVDAGHFLLHWATEGELDDWADSKPKT